jgi:hypothetical protein
MKYIKYNPTNLLFTAVLLSLTGCGREVEKKDLNIVFVTDHVISANDAPNLDLKALLKPIEPGTDHNVGFIPQIQVIRTDVQEKNTEQLDLSGIREKLSILPQGDFDYAAGLRRHAVEEKTKPFDVETIASNGRKVNLDSFILKQFPDALVIQYGTRPLSVGNFFTNMDTLKSFLKSELYKADFDASKQIVIVYKAKEPSSEPVAMKAEPKSYSVQLDKASFSDCHTLTWPNGSEGVSYKISWSNYEQRLGNSTYFQIPEQYRSKKLNVTLCAYANGYDSVIQCAQRLYKPCPQTSAGATRTVNTPNAADEPIGDMALRILNGVVVWNQKPGYVYRFTFSRGGKFDAEAALGPIQYTNYEGLVFLARNDVKIKDYIKNDIPYIFTLTAYKINTGTNKEDLVSCYMLPALSVRSIGQNSGKGFSDSYCEVERVPNKKCTTIN